jgi:hypothetical protein
VPKHFGRENVLWLTATPGCTEQATHAHGSFAAAAARSATAAKRDGDALSDAELPDRFSDRGDDSGEFVAWYMGQLNIGIVSHPSVPIASADTAAAIANIGSLGRCGWLAILLGLLLIGITPE